MTARAHDASTPSSRLDALRAKHNALKGQIESEQRSPSATDFYLRQLKKEKLMLKEEIEGTRRRASES